MPENRLESGFSAVQAHKRTPLQSNSATGFVRFRRIVAFCSAVIVKLLGYLFNQLSFYYWYL